MPRTIENVIEDLQRESRFMGRCGMVTTSNLIQEAVYWLKRLKETKEQCGEDDGK